ncbi:phage tail tape measure protein [Nonomuraea sp. NPDC005650]|uniref:phage tail tape measure protein n=1 Tax=Nonomuraea sp. NPDC005650 TaxID=3157045 RepID=UPI0033A25A05
METSVTRSLADIERAIADGLDPAAAIADLDRLEAALNASMADMDAEADRFAAELDAAMEEAFGDLDDAAQRGGQQAVDGLRTGLDGADEVAEKSGEQAGEQLVDGLKSGLKDAERVARGAGEDAGRQFGDGVENGGGGRGGGGGGRMAGIGSSLMGGLKAGAIGVAAAAGAAIGDALMGAIKTAMEKEDLFATLAVKVGAFGKESERLGEIAGELYADAYGESLGDVTDALARVLQNIDGAGKASDQVLKDMTAQALVVGKTMDEDVGAVTRAVSQILRNDLAPNAEEAFNILIRGQQEGVNKSEDLLDTFNEYSTIFRDLGLSGKDALSLLSQGLKAGARDSDTVADALKELDIRVKDLSAAKALKTLGLDAKEMASAFAKGGPKAREALSQILEKLGEIEDPAKRSQLAVALFGTKAEDMARSINGLNLDKAKTAVGDFKGAVDTASKTLGDTASADADKWSRSWEGAFAWLGEQAMNELQRMFPSPADAEADWNTFTAWFDTNVGPFFSEAWTAVSDTTLEIWNGIGDWLSTKASEIADDLGQAPGKVAEFFSSGWESLRSDTSAKWESIKKAATEKADAAAEWLRGIPGKIRDFFSSGWSDLQSDTSAKWEGIKKAATDKASDLVAWLKGLPGKIKAEFAAAGTWLLQAGRDLINGMINGVKAKAGELAAAARGTVQSAVDAAKNLLGIHSPSTVFAEIGKWSVKGLIQGLESEQGQAVSTVERMVDQIKKAFASKPDVADGLLKFVSIGNDSLAALAKQREDLVARLAAAKEYAKQVAGSAQEWADITGLKPEDIGGAGDMAAQLQAKASAINNFANNINTLARRGLNKKIIQDIIDAGVEKGATFAEMLVGSDGSEIKALNKAQAAVDKASKKLGKASADAMYDTGKKAGEGYLKGLQESLKALDKEMAKIVKALVSAIKKELKIKSPSQVMMEIGQQTIAGLAAGISNGSSLAVDAITGAASSVATAASNTLSGMVPAQGGAGPGMGIGYAGAPGTGVAYPTGRAPETQVGPSGGGVTVQIDMSNSVVREEPDIDKIGSKVAFNVMAQGLA